MTDSPNQFCTETSTVSNSASYHFSSHEVVFLKDIKSHEKSQFQEIWLFMEKGRSMFRAVALLFFMTWDNVVGKYKMFQVIE